jgi:alpha-mannosidase
VAAIKLAENNNDIILRCVETEGLDCMANLDLRFSGTKWQGKFRPFEIKTLRMNRKSRQIREVNLLEE